MVEVMPVPRIIQGGMGVGVSGWKLARAVSQTGQLGVVSGTLIDTVMVRRLQDGDPGGHVRRAMARFPFADVAAEVLRKYFRSKGRSPGEGYALLPMWTYRSGKARKAINMLAAFVEVSLSKEGHCGQVGMNLLTKVQLPNLSALYGAMLAGVDVILMGAGIPREIPGALDRLAAHERASLRFDSEGVRSPETATLDLDPAEYWSGPPPFVDRPRFLAIVASDTLATALARKATGRVDGFIVERHVSGGHNAPPRNKGWAELSGELIYDARDEADLEKLAALGLPFWLAGGMGRPGSLSLAERLGAVGIQVGTLFAYCEESGMDETLKRCVLAAVARGEVAVRTDSRASPTGFPFKIVEWPGDGVASGTRERRKCDLGYLRTPFRSEDGRIQYRCPAEPVNTFARKGGLEEDTKGRRCLCNSLLSTIGLAQLHGGILEPPLVTSGDQLEELGVFLNGRARFTAAQAVDYLLSSNPARTQDSEHRDAQLEGRWPNATRFLLSGPGNSVSGFREG